MILNESDIKIFWEKQAAKTYLSRSESLTNLEENDELANKKIECEKNVMLPILEGNNLNMALDLGAGIGVWTRYLAKYANEVHAVEYSPNLIKIGESQVNEENIANIKYICSSAQEYVSSVKYDFVLISGLVLYLNDSTFEQMLNNLVSYTKSGSNILVRESIGVHGRYIINNRYSKDLKTHYSAMYRSNDELINSFLKYGFRLELEKNMFEDGSCLNKWQETRLRVFLFSR